MIAPSNRLLPDDSNAYLTGPDLRADSHLSKPGITRFTLTWIED